MDNMPFRFLPLVFVWVTACGWGPIEADKQPDWPIFPNLGASGLTATPLDIEVNPLAKGNQFIGRRPDGTLIVFDQDMGVKRQLVGPYEEFRITESGVLYGVRHRNYEQQYVRFDSVDSGGREVLGHPLLTDDAFRKSVQSIGEPKQQCRAWAEGFRNYSKGYKCAFRLRFGVVIRYGDAEYLVKSDDLGCSYWIEGEDKNDLLTLVLPKDSSFDSCGFSDTSAYDDSKKNLQWLDSATQERHSSGNHFVFGFYLSGYSYYNLLFGKEKVSFKAYQANLPAPGLRLLKRAAPDKNSRVKLYLHETTQGKLYRVQARD